MEVLFFCFLHRLITTFLALQGILNNFLNSSVEEGSNLYNRIFDYVEILYKYQRDLNVMDDLSARSVSLAILALDSLIFNIYTKSKNSEANRLGQSIYASTMSLSGSNNKSQSNIDPSLQSPEMFKFLGFFQRLINCSDMFELLCGVIEEYNETEFIGDIAFAVIKHCEPSSLSHL